MKQSTARSLTLTLIAVALGIALAWAGSQSGWTIAGTPAFAVAVGIAYLVQWLAFIPAAIGRTDRFFDAVGSATYVAVTATLLALAPALDLRQVALGAMVMIWALRLGTFLLVRNIRSGGDDRFTEIRRDPMRFLSVWTVQGLWVSLTAAAAWIAISTAASAPVDWILWLGAALGALGFGIEVVADWQKSRFKKQPQHSGRFIRSGLWSVVRHPNYLGEILLWVGVFIAAAPSLLGWQWVAVLSPLFVVLLLTKVSGIPLLEAKAAHKWGDDPEYQAYVARTPRLIPFSTRPSRRLLD